MTRDDFNAFCSALPDATHVVQWGGADVWKVGGKVFAIGGWEEDAPAFTFKTSEMTFMMLGDQPGLRPAPYLASRGLKWIQRYAEPGLDDAALRDYLRESYRMIAAALPKAKRPKAEVP
jgi:predicted DNA-binding protein (MmcQ/YjbR family)